MSETNTLAYSSPNKIVLLKNHRSQKSFSNDYFYWTLSQSYKIFLDLIFLLHYPSYTVSLMNTILPSALKRSSLQVWWSKFIPKFLYTLVLELQIGTLTQKQSNLGQFYRDIFGVNLPTLFISIDEIIAEYSSGVAYKKC